MDFYNGYHGSLEIFGREVWLTDTIISTWIVMGVLIVFAIIVRLCLQNFETIPRGFQNVIEAIVELLENFTTSTMGKDKGGFTSFYGSLFLFILISNLTGLFGIRPPTADIATTFALAMITFFMIHGFGTKKKGMRYYKELLFDPIPLMMPLNLVGELATPISLSFRLFGNILGGTIIMGLYYSLPVYAKIGIPAVLHSYFDVFAGVLQTFIFVMLSMTFVSSAMDD